jgi:hypothetical protein
MASNSKKRQTFAKLTRERMVKEKRAKKQEKKDEKRLEAAALREPNTGDDASTPEIDEAEVRRLSRLR